MDTKANYTVVGAFVLVMMVVLILIIMWLTSMKHDETYNTYVTYMREEVSGLSIQSPVKYNGVKVGYVSSLRLNPHDPQQVIIVMKIEERTPITTSTIATLTAEGITGIDYVGLKALTAQAPSLKVRPGQLYPVIPSEPSLLMKLSTALQEVTQSISLLSKDVRLVFDEKNRENLSRSLANVQEVTHSVAINSQEISQSIKYANHLLKNSAEASEVLPGVMREIDTTLKELKKASHSVAKAGESVAGAMNETEMGMQSLSQQILPGTQQLLQRLNNLSGSLLQVSTELQTNPSMLFRGKTPAKLGPGEK